MCFKNLPIDVDAEDNGSLQEGVEDPWAIRREPERHRAGARTDQSDGALTRVVSVHGLHTPLVRRPTGARPRPTTPRTLN
jgi:hypothetical protein